MQKISVKLTVYFDIPFWVGVYERFTDEQLEVSKMTFGVEPKDYEVYQFLLQNSDKLRFSPPLEAELRSVETINPKRRQGAIKKHLTLKGVGTHSQQALKLQHDENKIIKKTTNRNQKEAKKRHQFEQRQKKRKEKHKGR